VNVRSASVTGGTVEIHLDKVDGPLLAQVQIPKGSQWQVVSSKLLHAPRRNHDLVVAQKGDGKVDLDWITFD